MMQYGLVVVWLATYLVLALAALPLAGLLFGRLADRGAAFAFPLALAVLGVVGYLVGQVAFGWPALLAGLAVLLASSYLAGARVDIDRRGAIEAGIVFSVAFLLLVAIRSVDPAVHPLGGEKFLDFGLLNTLLRSGALPPEDMWFAGEPVRYYYGGHMLAALLSVLTSTPAQFAYNLSLAGYYAAFVTAAWGLASNIAAAYGHRQGGSGAGRGPNATLAADGAGAALAADGSKIRTRRWLAGGLGAFFAGLASNLATPGRVVLWLLPEGLAQTVGNAAGLPSHVVTWTPRQFSYWDASRVIPLNPAEPDGLMLITEFPLFAWLNGDLHAHMMSTPFMLLLAGLLFSYWRTPEEERWRRRVLIFGAVTPVAGFLAVVNTWSFPTTAGLTLLALTFAPAAPLTLLPTAVVSRLRGAVRLPGVTPAGQAETVEDADTTAGSDTPESSKRPDGGTVRADLARWLGLEISRTGLALVLAVGMLAVAAAWVLPFWFGTASGRAIGTLPIRSPLGGLLLVHGTFLLVFIPYLGVRTLAGTTDPLATVAVAILAGVVAWLAGFAAVALLVPLVVAGWWLLRTHQDVGFETVLFIAGAGLILLVEFLFVEEQAGPGRMNTVFKTYAQVWALWAPAAGVALARMATVTPTLDLSAPRRQRMRQIGAVLAVVLVFSSSLYAGFALINHFGRGGIAADAGNPSLDATAFVEVRHPDEAPAIRWIDELDGQPTIVTQAPASYRWNAAQGKGASAPSSLTGVPTVLGWYHELGYRGQEPFRERVRDVGAIYTGRPARQADYLRQYNVQYVYVGPAERAQYDQITIGAVPGVQPHQQLGDVVIYRVNQDELPD